MLTIVLSLVKPRMLNSVSLNKFLLRINFRLIVAASAGFSKACTMLIENGANIYSIDQNGT